MCGFSSHPDPIGRRKVAASASLAATMLAVTSSVAVAQSASDGASDARFRFGPLSVTPAISLSQGIDTNVFNVEDEADQQRDFIVELTPGLAIWLKAGVANVTVRSGLTATYFQRHHDEGSVGTTQDVTIDVPLWRFRPFVRRSFLTMRNRPSLDIDVRARHADDAWAAGSEVRLSARTKITIAGERQRTQFDDDETFQGASLPAELNRTRERFTSSLSYELTPLTTVEVNTGLARDEFDGSTRRNAQSVRVSSAVLFKPFTLFSGRAELGYLRFNPSDSGLEPYRGLAASIDLSYVLRDTTRFAVALSRDVEYSFDAETPYYVLTGLSVNVTQRLGTRWSATGSASNYRLAYKTFVPLAPAVANTMTSPDRGDATRVFGGELGYALTRRSRLGVRVEKSQRQAVVVGRSHSGVRTMLTLSITP